MCVCVRVCVRRACVCEWMCFSERVIVVLIAIKGNSRVDAISTRRDFLALPFAGLLELFLSFSLSHSLSLSLSLSASATGVKKNNLMVWLCRCRRQQVHVHFPSSDVRSWRLGEPVKLEPNIVVIRVFQ